MTKTIRQTVTIGAPPKDVYLALVNEKRHASFTGSPAKISDRVGEGFSCYGGYVRGTNLDLVPGSRIVQAWRAKDWAPGAFSIVSFELKRAPGGTTRLSFTHTGVPSNDFRDKTKGWRTHYWKPLKAYLER